MGGWMVVIGVCGLVGASCAVADRFVLNRRKGCLYNALYRLWDCLDGARGGQARLLAAEAASRVVERHSRHMNHRRSVKSESDTHFLSPIFDRSIGTMPIFSTGDPGLNLKSPLSGSTKSGSTARLWASVPSRCAFLSSF